jgi:hypothetical protein
MQIRYSFLCIGEVFSKIAGRLTQDALCLNCVFFIHWFCQLCLAIDSNSQSYVKDYVKNPLNSQNSCYHMTQNAYLSVCYQRTYID